MSASYTTWAFFWGRSQRLQWTQIIWVCPDIWVFSVLDNRHLADICAFCQKCQFEVRKAWNALFLQLKPHEMHCKQADSAILKIRCGWNYANCEYVLFAYGLLSYSDFKQTRAFVAKRDMSQIWDQGNLVPPGWRRISADTTAVLCPHSIVGFLQIL